MSRDKGETSRPGRIRDDVDGVANVNGATIRGERATDSYDNKFKREPTDDVVAGLDAPRLEVIELENDIWLRRLLTKCVFAILLLLTIAMVTIAIVQQVQTGSSELADKFFTSIFGQVEALLTLIAGYAFGKSHKRSRKRK